MSREAEVITAMKAIEDGKAAKDVESYTLDFKEHGRSHDETVKSVVEAAICFANSAGGVVVLGVSNKERGPGAFKGTAITSEDVKKRIYDLTNPHLLVDSRAETRFGASLVLIHVPQSPEIHADMQGRALRRVATDCHPMSPTEQMILREERLGIDWSEQLSSRPLTDISPVALASARQVLGTLTGPRRGLASASDKELLRALGLVNNRGQLLRAGEVLLCDPRGGVDAPIVYQYHATQGGEPVIVQRLRTSLLVAFQRALELIQARRNLTPLNLPSGQQLQIEDFPEIAIREAIANAVIHRDYHASSPVTIEHSAEVFVVSSPGPLVSGVTADNILTHPSKPRNPRLAAAARRLGLAEEIGRGVDRMFREMIRSGREIPRIEGHFDRVRVTFVGGAPNTHIARYVAQLPESERENTDTMLSLLRLCSKSSLTAVELAPVLQKTAEEAETVLQRLSSDGVGMVEATRESARRRRPSYRLRGDALKALGSAVTYRRRTVDEIDRKVIAHVKEYGKVTNRTVQNLLDASMTRSKQILQDLVARDMLQKISEHERGPGVEYGPGPKFPSTKRKAVAHEKNAAEQLSLGSALGKAAKPRRKSKRQ